MNSDFRNMRLKKGGRLLEDLPYKDISADIPQVSVLGFLCLPNSAVVNYANDKTNDVLIIKFNIWEKYQVKHQVKPSFVLNNVEITAQTLLKQFKVNKTKVCLVKYHINNLILIHNVRENGQITV